MKILLCGPRHSGKTCLREALRRLILRRSQGRLYPNYLPGNPDGDGRWYVETARRDRDQARQLRREAPLPFDQPFTQRVCDAIQRHSAPLLLVDLGGLLSPENEAICALPNTHAILLYKSEAELAEWRALTHNSTILAELHTIQQRLDTDFCSLDNGVLRGQVSGLDLEARCDSFEVVQELANHILHLLPSDAFQPPPQDHLTLQFDSLGLDLPGALVSVRLNTDSTSNEVLVQTVWDTPIPAAALAHAELVQIDGPLTMPVAVALALSLRSHAPKADIAIYDPDTGGQFVSLDLHGPLDPVLQPPLKLQPTWSGNHLSLDLSLLSGGCSKRELLQSLALQLRAANIPRTFERLRISGRVPVAVAAALALHFFSPSLQVLVFDPVVDRGIPVWPPSPGVRHA